MTKEQAIKVHEEGIKLAQAEIDRLKVELEAERAEPGYPPGTIVWEERMVVSYSKASPAGAPYTTASVCEGNTSFAPCFTSAKHLRPRVPDEPTALYEEGKVLWSRRNERVFVLTGKVIPENKGWHLVGTTLCSPTIYGINSYPEARILDVKVYEVEGERYIHDGGRERQGKLGESYLFAGSGGIGITTETDIKGMNTPRRMLVKLREVG